MTPLQPTAPIKLADILILLMVSIAITMVMSMVEPKLTEQAGHNQVHCAYQASTVGISRQIDLLDWNIAKLDFQRATERLGANNFNLLTLQEVPIDGSLLFSSGHIGIGPTGVAIQTNAEANRICRWQSYEPILRTPKAGIAAVYPIEGSHQELMVINLHGVNFSWLLGTWKSQIRIASLLIKSHHGPVILAGDLNTWRYERWRFVIQQAQGLGLSRPDYVIDERTAPFGYPLDWILSRGIEWESVNSPTNPLSDHNPIMATGRIVLPQETD